MSWKLVFGLSLFGLAMGIARVLAIPLHVEPYAWLAVFVVSAIAIAKRAPARYFLHGLCVSLLDAAWVTIAHVALFDRYVAGHGHEAALAEQYASLVGSTKIVMAITGPVVGVASGIVLGLLAYVMSKFLVSSHSEYAGW